jgi:two-component system cell cycle sensor histidine kinase/response regulator CckA
VSKNVLRLLIAEDSANDAILLLAELEREGYAPQHHRVETKRDFLKALQDHSWDAVIADYSLPHFSGPEALKLLRQQELDLPFILVSGVIGEETAVAMMKAGADDYILKGNLARLAPALEREIEAAQDRRRHRRAMGAMQYLAAIVDSSEDAIYGKNLDSLIVSWNPAAERLFGYSAEEIIGRSTLTLFPQNRRDEMLDILASIRRGQTVGIRETERLHKSGRVIPVWATVSPIMNVAGEIIGASSIVRDISQLKQVEHDLQMALADRENLVDELQEALKHVKTLQGLLPVCAFCHKIRDANGKWERFETYIRSRTDADFTHGFCPECIEAHYGVMKPHPKP